MANIGKNGPMTGFESLVRRVNGRVGKAHQPCELGTRFFILRECMRPTFLPDLQPVFDFPQPPVGDVEAGSIFFIHVSASYKSVQSRKG